MQSTSSLTATYVPVARLTNMSNSHLPTTHSVSPSSITMAPQVHFISNETMSSSHVASSSSTVEQLHHDQTVSSVTTQSPQPYPINVGHVSSSNNQIQMYNTAQQQVVFFDTDTMTRLLSQLGYNEIVFMPHGNRGSSGTVVEPNTPFYIIRNSHS